MASPTGSDDFVTLSAPGPEGGTAIVDMIVPDGVTSIATVRIPALNMELELYIDTKATTEEMLADIQRALTAMWPQLLKTHQHLVLGLS